MKVRKFKPGDLVKFRKFSPQSNSDLTYPQWDKVYMVSRYNECGTVYVREIDWSGYGDEDLVFANPHKEATLGAKYDKDKADEAELAKLEQEYASEVFRINLDLKMKFDRAVRDLKQKQLHGKTITFKYAEKVNKNNTVYGLGSYKVASEQGKRGLPEAFSVSATEHSVMTMFDKNVELLSSKPLTVDWVKIHSAMANIKLHDYQIDYVAGITKSLYYQKPTPKPQRYKHYDGDIYEVKETNGEYRLVVIESLDSSMVGKFYHGNRKSFKTQEDLIDSCNQYFTKLD